MELEFELFSLFFGDLIFQTFRVWWFIWIWVYWPDVVARFGFNMHQFLLGSIFGFFIVVKQYMYEREHKLAYTFNKVQSELFWIAKQHLPDNIFFVNYLEEELRFRAYIDTISDQIRQTGDANQDEYESIENYFEFVDDFEADDANLPVYDDGDEDESVNSMDFSRSELKYADHSSAIEHDVLIERDGQRFENFDVSSRLLFDSTYGYVSSGANSNEFALSSKFEWGEANYLIEATNPNLVWFNILLPFGLTPIKFSVDLTRFSFMGSLSPDKFDILVPMVRRQRWLEFRKFGGFVNRKFVFDKIERKNFKLFRRISPFNKSICRDLLYAGNEVYASDIIIFNNKRVYNNLFFPQALTSEGLYDFSDFLMHMSWKMQLYLQFLSFWFDPEYGEPRFDHGATQALHLTDRTLTTTESVDEDSVASISDQKWLTMNEYNVVSFSDKDLFDIIYERKIKNLHQDSQFDENSFYMQKYMYLNERDVKKMQWLIKLPECYIYDYKSLNKVTIKNCIEHTEFNLGVGRTYVDELTMYDSFLGSVQTSTFNLVEHGLINYEFYKISPSHIRLNRGPIYLPPRLHIDFWRNEYFKRVKRARLFFRPVLPVLLGTTLNLWSLRLIILNNQVDWWAESMDQQVYSVKYAALNRVGRVWPIRQSTFANSDASLAIHQRFFEQAGLHDWDGVSFSVFESGAAIVPQSEIVQIYFECQLVDWRIMLSYFEDYEDEESEGHDSIWEMVDEIKLDQREVEGCSIEEQLEDL